MLSIFILSFCLILERATNEDCLMLSIIVEVKWFDLCLVLAALQCFTGCDTIRAFVKKGKITLLIELE